MRESIGGIAQLVVKVHDADLKTELQAAVLNAQGEALDLQERVAKLQQENAELSQNNRSLREELRLRDRADEIEKELYFAQNAYWRDGDTGLFAYCSGCWDTKRQLVRLNRSYGGQKDGSPGYAGVCPGCRSIAHNVFYGNRPTRDAMA